jgi:hypothetical protein
MKQNIKILNIIDSSMIRYYCIYAFQLQLQFLENRKSLALIVFEIKTKVYNLS